MPRRAHGFGMRAHFICVFVVASQLFLVASQMVAVDVDLIEWNKLLTTYNCNLLNNHLNSYQKSESLTQRKCLFCLCNLTVSVTWAIQQFYVKNCGGCMNIGIHACVAAYWQHNFELTNTHSHAITIHTTMLQPFHQNAINELCLQIYVNSRYIPLSSW